MGTVDDVVILSVNPSYTASVSIEIYTRDQAILEHKYKE